MHWLLAPVVAAGRFMVAAVVAMVLDAVNAAVEHPSAATVLALVLTVWFVLQGARLHDLGLLGAVSWAVPATIVAITWREFGRYRRAVWVGLVAATPLALGWVAARHEGAVRWDALWLMCAWVLIVFAPGDVLWPGQPGGLVYRRLGTGTFRAWWNREAARETIESSMRRTIDPRVQVGRIRAMRDGHWMAEVLVPEKMAPKDVTEKAVDVTLGSTMTRLAAEKGFGETVQGVEVRPAPVERGQGRQLVSVFTGTADPLAATSTWPLPASVPATLDPVNLGRYADGSPVLVPVPGVGGGHVLLGGVSGSGKTVAEHAYVGQLAMRHNVALLLSDPKQVGLIGWRPRATTIALGPQSTVPMLGGLVQLMQHRMTVMRAHGLDDWDLALGPWVVLVIDEGGVLGLEHSGTPIVTAMYQVLTMGRALGVGVLLALHRPSTNKLASDLRELHTVRIGLRMKSSDGSQMVFGEKPPPCQAIGRHEQGVGFIDLDDEPRRFRTHLPPCDVATIARCTAELRVPSGVGEFAGWPHVVTDPAADVDGWAEFTKPAETKTKTPRRRQGKALAESEA